MRIENLLSLHEAIVVSLLQQPLRRDHIDNIKKIIKERNLYITLDNNATIDDEVKLLYGKLSKDDKDELFFDLGTGYIQLKDSYANFSMHFWESLKEFLVHERHFFEPEAVILSLFDTEFELKRDVKLWPDKIICIVSNDKNMGKDIYIILPTENEPYSVRKFSVNDDSLTFKKLQNKIDPLNNYLCSIARNAIVNVAFFEITENNVLKPSILFEEILNQTAIMFPSKGKAKDNIQNFNRMKSHYQRNVLLQKMVIASDNGMNLLPVTNFGL